MKFQIEKWLNLFRLLTAKQTKKYFNNHASNENKFVKEQEGVLRNS